MELQLTPVATGLGFPEGPVAMADDGSLLFVEIQAQRMSRLRGDGKVERVLDIPGGPNGLAVGPDGAIYICNNGGVYDFVPNCEVVPGRTVTVPAPTSRPYRGGSIQRFDPATGALTTLYDNCNGAKLLAPDDIVFDKSGGFWFTTSGHQDEELLHKGGLYYASTDGKSIVKAATIPMANGVGLSPDGQTVYVTDTLFGRLWALEIDHAMPTRVKPGLLKDVMPGGLVQVLPSVALPQEMLPGFSLPARSVFQWVDSLAVDDSGKVWVGTLFNGGITIFDPATGKTDFARVADPFTTNLCFGGPDMRDVWITASSTGTIYKGRSERPGLKLAFPRTDATP
ncbi:MAG: SMP-30/gluconolactonase/LRE family protein [Roseomonas sp.]|nr:SMP-30/gluconolactonase/LRE family protein [Roseomonas sp.]